MPKPLELIANRLRAATEGRHGLKAEFCRAVEMSASQVDAYIKGTTSPTLAVIERLAKHWGLQPWQLIRPDDAESPPAVTPIDAGELGEVIAALMQNPKMLGDVRELLGIPDADGKRKNR